MKRIEFNKDKSKQLKDIRGISFEDVMLALENKQLVDIIKHPNKKKYPNQNLYLININGYIWVIPYVEDRKKIFLKTVYPSRKFTKKYLHKES